MVPTAPRSSVHRILTGTAAFVIVIAGMHAASSLLVLLLLSIFITIIVTPVFFALQRRGLPSWAALLLLILVLVLLSTVGASVLLKSVNAITRNLPVYQTMLEGKVDRLAVWMESKGMETAREELRGYFTGENALDLVRVTLTATSSLLSQVAVVLLIVIFLLLEAARLPAKLNAIPGFTEADNRRLHEAVESVRQYMNAKTLMSILTGVLVGVLLFAFRVSYAPLLGVLAFLLNYVPNIGSFMAAIPGVILALILHGGASASGVAIGYVVINVGIGNFLEPRVMGRRLGLSPMIVVVSLVFWGWVLGPVGMLLSVPLTMTAKVFMFGLEDTRGLAILMGSAAPAETAAEPPGHASSSTSAASEPSVKKGHARRPRR